MKKKAFLLVFCIIIRATAQGCVSDSPSFYGYAGHLLGVDDMQSVQLTFDFNNPLEEKRCPDCCLTLPVHQFTKCKTAKDGLAFYCRECTRKKARVWAEANKEKRKEKRQQDHAGPSDEERQARRASYRAYYRDTIEKRRFYEDRRKQDHSRLEYKRQYQKNYRTQKKEMANASIAKWRKANPDKVRAKNISRRTRQKSIDGKFTSAQWRVLLRYCGDQCLNCGIVPKKLTVDHIVPVIEGGTSSIWNLQPLCSKCNSTKNAKAIDYRPGNVRRLFSNPVQWAEAA